MSESGSRFIAGCTGSRIPNPPKLLNWNWECSKGRGNPELSGRIAAETRTKEDAHAKFERLRHESATFSSHHGKNLRQLVSSGAAILIKITLLVLLPAMDLHKSFEHHGN